MKRATGIGGVFFKAKDPEKIKQWYGLHLGLNIDSYGTSFEWQQANSSKKGYTAWSPMKESTDYFSPSEKQFMINFRVENLDALLGALKTEGVQQIGEMQVYEYGKFAHIMDPEGNKIELWEANDEEYEKISEGKTT